MSNHQSPTDMTNFEVATIRDGHQVNVVYRRRGPAILTRLSPAARHAVETYTATAEAVLSGGASAPRDSLNRSIRTSGGPASEGRQAGFVDQVAFLRRMEAAVGQDPIILRDRPRVAADPLDLWRRVCLGDMSIKAYLTQRKGLARSDKRMKALQAAFVAACDRVSDAIGSTKSPLG
jgi:hypothetical protein